MVMLSTSCCEFCRAELPFLRSLMTQDTLSGFLDCLLYFVSSLPCSYGLFWITDGDYAGHVYIDISYIYHRFQPNIRTLALCINNLYYLRNLSVCTRFVVWIKWPSLDLVALRAFYYPLQTPISSACMGIYLRTVRTGNSL